jgi:hypothetical protein
MQIDGDCLYCLNFAAQAFLYLRDEFLSMLEKLGIDPAGEGEVYEAGTGGLYANLRWVVLLSW